MKTGSHLRIKPMGTNVLGVTLEGNPSKPEPEMFCVKFPGGEIYVSRTTEGDHWAHICRNRAEDGFVVTGEAEQGALVDGRLDVEGMHSAEVPIGALQNPGLYHIAVRVARR